ncbi:hypothetical protein DL766_007700 [Monosporascus sp. MC13-8B]|nr:hypothetical protein DL763_010768 [Monosporascus cannonballus]RYP22599.1 hypothetical protein DL766_007700 [Monosporascus sp. MC13-8B]
MSGRFRPVNNPPRTTGPWRPINQRRPARIASRNEPPDATRARPTARDVEGQRSLDDDNNTDPTDTDVEAGGDVSMGDAGNEGPSSSDSMALEIAAWQEQQQATAEGSKSPSSSSPLRSSSGSSVTDDPGDDYGSKDERARAAGGKPTYGIEPEFLLAYTVRNRCVDALRRARIVANKTDEIDLRDSSMGASGGRGHQEGGLHRQSRGHGDGGPQRRCAARVVAGRDFFPVPPNNYRWWGAEVITPVYDTENRACTDNIRRAVQQLREEFRIHKPMAAVRSGVHVHWGHQDGWTLLQLKRFASLWVVIEESLFRLHRSDRSNFNYCRSLREHSRLAYALSPDNPAHRAKYRDSLPQGGSAVSQRYDRYTASRIPLDSLGSMDGRLPGLVQNIWRYPHITTLATAMSPWSFTDEAAVRWDVIGEKRSDDPSMASKQTLEFRMMQGTLDFEHIMHWMQVCHRVILVSRSAPDETFYAIMEQLCKKASIFDALRVSRATHDYFLQHLDYETDPNGCYWVYPDRDRVAWAQPFMSKGNPYAHPYSPKHDNFSRTLLPSKPPRATVVAESNHCGTRSGFLEKLSGKVARKCNS